MRLRDRVGCGVRGKSESGEGERWVRAVTAGGPAPVERVADEEHSAVEKRHATGTTLIGPVATKQKGSGHNRKSDVFKTAGTHVLQVWERVGAGYLWNGPVLRSGVKGCVCGCTWTRGGGKRER